LSNYQRLKRREVVRSKGKSMERSPSADLGCQKLIAMATASWEDLFFFVYPFDEDFLGRQVRADFAREKPKEVRGSIYSSLIEKLPDADVSLAWVRAYPAKHTIRKSKSERISNNKKMITPVLPIRNFDFRISFHDLCGASAIRFLSGRQSESRFVAVSESGTAPNEPAAAPSASLVHFEFIRPAITSISPRASSLRFAFAVHLFRRTPVKLPMEGRRWPSDSFGKTIDNCPLRLISGIGQA